MPLPDALTRIHWTIASCRLLAATMAEFQRDKPFHGLTIGTAIHLEPKTAALLLTLAAGGARIVSTGNLNSSIVLDLFRARLIFLLGITEFSKSSCSIEERAALRGGQYAALDLPQFRRQLRGSPALL